MNCWRGICMYKDDNGKCKRDKKKCDLNRESIPTTGTRVDECRYGYISCQECYDYALCDET